MKTKNENITAIILAAGLGTRMKPFSFTLSKVMIPFLGKPLIAYHIDEFIKNNILDFIIVCNKNNIHEIRNYFRKNYKTYKFKYVVQPKQLGPVHGIYTARKYIHDDFFIVKYGDSISEEDQIAKLISQYSKDKTTDGVTTFRKVKNPQEYGIAKFNLQKQLIKIVEKPKENPPSNYANVGLALINSKTFIKAVENIGFNEILPPTEYLLRFKRKLSYRITKAKHIDLGRPWDILEATKLFIDKFGGKIETQHISNAKISKRSYLGHGTILEKNVKIGDYCHIDCYVGKGTKLDRTYVMENTKIGDYCTINSSVIGKNNLIGNNFKTLT